MYTNYLTQDKYNNLLYQIDLPLQGAREGVVNGNPRRCHRAELTWAFSPNSKDSYFIKSIIKNIENLVYNSIDT